MIHKTSSSKGHTKIIIALGLLLKSDSIMICMYLILGKGGVTPLLYKKNALAFTLQFYSPPQPALAFLVNMSESTN